MTLRNYRWQYLVNILSIHKMLWRRLFSICQKDISEIIAFKVWLYIIWSSISSFEWYCTKMLVMMYFDPNYYMATLYLLAVVPADIVPARGFPPFQQILFPPVRSRLSKWFVDAAGCRSSRYCSRPWVPAFRSNDLWTPLTDQITQVTLNTMGKICNTQSEKKKIRRYRPPSIAIETPAAYWLR